MNDSSPISSRLRWRAALWTSVRVIGAAGVVTGVAFSAVVTKDARSRSKLPPLVQLDAQLPPPGTAGAGSGDGTDPSAGPADSESVTPDSIAVRDPLIPAEPDDTAAIIAAAAPEVEETYYPPETKWFNGRPVRPARTVSMLVTAYTPDEISCGDSADGITSSNHSVYTNGMRLVAADSRVLPLGSMVTVPGYAGDAIVPVLDRGGKIKGNRLDVLYPDNATARKWGKQSLKVTVWEYADGKPADDWRAIRDSRKR